MNPPDNASLLDRFALEAMKSLLATGCRHQHSDAAKTDTRNNVPGPTIYEPQVEFTDSQIAEGFGGAAILARDAYEIAEQMIRAREGAIERLLAEPPSR